MNTNELIMRKAILAVLAVMLLMPPQGCAKKKGSKHVIGFYNVENLFNTTHDQGKNDYEFLPDGANEWTPDKYASKLHNMARVIADMRQDNGVWHTVLGLAEVENREVVEALIAQPELVKAGYKIVHFESPDRRGIDVGLLYRKSRLRFLSAKPCHIFEADSTVMLTRDILLATFIGPDGDTLAMMVNHHPSKFGGTAISEPRRERAVERLKQLADSLKTLGIQHIIAMGDFNDTPGNPVYHKLEPLLWNKAETFHRRGEGTIKFNGKWEVIDMFFVSEPLLQAEMDIIYIPFLQAADKGASGTKPLRTYSGPRYLGGVSDHCPIWLSVEVKR